MRLKAVIAAILCLFVTATAAQSRAVLPQFFPPAIRGLWVADNAEGKSQCRAYKNADNANDDEMSRHLVGATIVSSRVVHDYSEYGEGNFFLLLGYERQTGRQSWRVKTALGIDHVPEENISQIVVLTLALSRGKLIIQREFGNAPHQAAERMVRCAKVPADMYVWGPKE
jgi:hypothetical protein